MFFARSKSIPCSDCSGKARAMNCATILATDAEKHWRRLRGYKLITQVIEGVPFIDGEMKEAA